MSGDDQPPIVLGQHISDPRALSDALSPAPDTCASSSSSSSSSSLSLSSSPYDTSHSDMYSGLANYTFGNPRPSSPSSLSPYDASSEASESISPLTSVLPRLSPDRTPRPSVSSQPASPPLHNVSSHPSQGAGRPASSLCSSTSQSRRHSAMRESSYSSGSRSRAVSGSSDGERSQDPTPSTDPIPIIAAYFSPQRGNVMSDDASHHTFGPASRIHGGTAAYFHDGEMPSSSSVSVTTSRSSSRASMHTTEQYSSDDDLDSDAPSPVTFARDDLADIDEVDYFIDPGPSTIRSSILDGRRGSLPMAIPGALQAGDAYSSRSREGSTHTVRRPSRSWDAASARRSSYSGDDPTLVLPRSEPHSRADWLSLEAQQAPVANAYDGLDLQYILSRRSEGSIRSFMHLGPGASPRIPPAALSQGSFTTLPGEDSFTRLLRHHDREFDVIRYYWSFQREKADASSASLLRRQQAYHSRTDRSGREVPPRVQEMWRCGHVGRFKVERLAFRPPSADPARGAQQRIHVRHIPDPFLGAITSGPHSIIHKHSRAIAFSIFRSHGLFSGRQPGGGGIGHTSGQTHINMRLAIMLAPKNVQEQYTSTKTVRQLETHRLLDNESHGPRDKGKRRGQDKKEERSKGKGKTKSQSRSKGKGKDKDKGDSKHRLNPTESTESSTAASSAGGVTSSAVHHLISATERPAVNIQLSPSVSSSMSVYKHDPASRPASPTSSLPPSITKVSESETSMIPPIRHHRDHRDSIDSDDRWPTRTTHAEAFSALDPNDIENLRAKANNSRSNTDSGSTLERLLFRVFRGSSKIDDHPLSNAQPRAFQPPWMITAGRDQQEETDRVLNDLNASFRDVGLLHTNPHRSSKVASKRKSTHSILDQIPDDYLYMLLPLWPGETDAESLHAETSSAASFITIPENRRYLLVHYVPYAEANPKDKKPEKKKPKQSHSSDSGVEADGKTICLSAFYAVARVVTYDELRLSGVRIPSDGLAINGPEWEAMNYPDCSPPPDNIVVCQCEGREQGFHFMMDGLLKLGLCIQEEYPVQDLSDPEADRREGRTVLTPIGKAAVEMIWLGCLAITSFGSV